jgi:phosphocarrier protein HPr
MTSREVVIGHRLGLHARASAKLVRLAGRYRSEISLSRVDNDCSEPADGRSILGILLLAAGQGNTVRVQADGEDEREAVDAICEYLAD